MKIGLAIVIVAIVIAAGALIGIRLLTPPVSPLEGEVDVDLINGETVQNLNFSFLSSLPQLTEFTSYQNRFENWRSPGIYVGVSLATLVEQVGGIDANDIVRVNATDGYSQYFAYYNLYPNASFTMLQGELILAYAYNNTTPTSWEDGPRIAFLPDDGGYSNDDANQTTHPAWFSGSAGARWVSNVASIEILHDVYISGSLHFTLIDGVEELKVYLVDLALMNSREGYSAYQRITGNWGGNGTYVGVTLSAIIELVTTIDANDVVNVSASDGYTQSFAYYNIYPNSSIYALQGDLILAYIYNGVIVSTWTDGPRLAFLAPDGGYSNDDANKTTHPTWFSGSGSTRWVKNVFTIEILQDSFPP